MRTAQLRDFLVDAAGALDCGEVALRCEDSTLETVFVLVREGALVVTDRGETFRYLGTSGDADYSMVPLRVARSICERHGVDLRADDPEMYATLERAVLDETSAADAIARVASAVEDLFAAAGERR